MERLLYASDVKLISDEFFSFYSINCNIRFRWHSFVEMGILDELASL